MVQESGSHIIKGNKRILSPEIILQQKKQGNSTEVGSSILSKNNKNSFSQPNQAEVTRKSETNYQNFAQEKLKSSQT
jgi:hypothetical protein